jgi:hypothetical protein
MVRAASGFCRSTSSRSLLRFIQMPRLTRNSWRTYALQPGEQGFSVSGLNPIDAVTAAAGVKVCQGCGAHLGLVPEIPGRGTIEDQYRGREILLHLAGFWMIVGLQPTKSSIRFLAIYCVGSAPVMALVFSDWKRCGDSSCPCKHSSLERAWVKPEHPVTWSRAAPYARFAGCQGHSATVDAWCHAIVGFEDITKDPGHALTASIMPSSHWRGSMRSPMSVTNS